MLLIVNVLSIYAAKEKEAIAQNVLRLHVVANSDSENDQKLKLLVRDNIIKEFGDELSLSANKNEAILFVNEHKNEMYKVARETLIKEGCYDDLEIFTGKCEFPLKVYEDVKLPHGTYDAINIKIGEAKGKNWWCVMYPPLCFTSCTEGEMDESDLENLKKNLGKERFSVITEENDYFKIKFKILELF